MKGISLTRYDMLGGDEAYRTLFNNLLNGLAYCRMIYEGREAVDFVYLAINEAFVRQTGLSDVLGRRASEVIPGLHESDGDLIRIYGRVAKTGAPERFERFVSALQMWFSVSVYSPAPDHFVAIFDSITDRKHAETALRESERRLLRVIEGSDQGFWDWNLLTNTFTVSARFETMLGFAPGEMDVSPANWAKHVHPDDLAKARASIARNMSGESANHEVELRCRTKSGEWRWILTRGRIVERDAEGHPTMMSGTHTDITDRKNAEHALRQTAIVFENTREGVLITDARSSILSVNQAFTQITGFDRAEVLGRTPSLLKSGRHDETFYSSIWAHLGASGYWQGEVWNRRRSGEIYPQLTTINAVHDSEGRVTHYVGVFTDISAIKASEERLEFLAHHDPLTSLPNRLMLFSRLEHAMSVARRDEGLIALLMIDLDHFKEVNDSYGHLMGDHLLQRVAERLGTRLRGADTLARLGGDEFTVLLEEIARSDDAGRVADEILAELTTPWPLPNGAEVRIAASIGIALYPGQAQTAEELLQQADAAMYRAKMEGRGRYQYFSEDLTHTARARIELESRLRHAIDDGELQLFFQPQVDIGSGKIVGAEALVRWFMPGKGMISPDEFIPLAEETGLILALGRWVLRETCRIGRDWLNRGLSPLVLTVNISPAQLRHPGFADEVLSILAETGFPAKWLALELTESALMCGYDEVITQLQTLQQHAIRMAIDDFGIGYSSLADLKRAPLDGLKIDRSFIAGLAHRRDDQDIVTAIIQMGHTLGFKLMAEGVETDEQLAFLKEQGCDAYQGHLRCHPLSACDFEAFMRCAD
ncbi:MAG: diguanylate cyclase/phosphodiesterase with sensor(s) [Proteobacteria bacterium]|nr:diguanylate cyclase/phosphodiesterase with sensor(s) [Pseudomonadota bacterium]